MTRALCLLLAVLFLPGCSEKTEPVRLVHTSFSESSGLTVTGSDGKSQQLISESLGTRVVVSPDSEWILVEDMQLSNLVVIRAFRYADGAWRETSITGIRPQWQALADQAGVTIDDLVRPRVGIEKFGAPQNTVLLHFQADILAGDLQEVDSVVEIELSAD